MKSAASRMDKGLQTHRLGSLQAWMFERGWRRLPNALSTTRWLLWRATGGDYETNGPATDARSVRAHDAKIWNLPETPAMFHRQAPGLPMTTRCGLAMGREARSTTHALSEFKACPVCFEGWGE